VKFIGLCGGYNSPSTKNTNFDFYLNIRWKNGVSINSPIPWSKVQSFWVNFLSLPHATTTLPHILCGLIPYMEMKSIPLNPSMTLSSRDFRDTLPTLTNQVCVTVYPRSVGKQWYHLFGSQAMNVCRYWTRLPNIHLLCSIVVSVRPADQQPRRVSSFWSTCSASSSPSSRASVSFLFLSGARQGLDCAVWTSWIPPKLDFGYRKCALWWRLLSLRYSLAYYCRSVSVPTRLDVKPNSGSTCSRDGRLAYQSLE
jgi:hypothetical protein